MIDTDIVKSEESQSQIPKIIHYCWVGRNPLPSDVRKYIESWKKYLPDYVILEWNEDNFDITSNRFVQEAYDSKKWAFVSDYVRLYVLYNYGGIYLDTDVEVLKNLDVFLHHEAFSGFETGNIIPTGIIGARKNNPWIKHLLTYYENRSFYRNDGTLDLTANTKIITHMTQELDASLHLDNSYQELKSGVVLYPNDFFCPKDGVTGIITQTENTYTIHHFAGSWLPEKAVLLKEKKIKFFNKHPYILKIRQSKIGDITIKLLLPIWEKYTLNHRKKDI